MAQFPKLDTKVQYKPDNNVKPVRDAYAHPLLTGIQMGCRTRLTRGFAERDMTNYPAASRYERRVREWRGEAKAENREYAESI